MVVARIKDACAHIKDVRYALLYQEGECEKVTFKPNKVITQTSFILTKS